MRPAATRPRAVARAVESGFNGSGLLARPGNALAHQAEAWGPGEQEVEVAPGRTVPLGLDALAAEIDACMTEDGW